MITIDHKTQAMASASKLKKGAKSDKNRKTAFAPSKQTHEASSNESFAGVADVGGMLFLQEFDQYAQDKQNLEEFGNKALKTLKELQLEILSGRINGAQLHSLKKEMDSNKFIISTPELAILADEIKIRIEVEIAKIEVNRSADIASKNLRPQI
ncbi:MAG: hypothetical protein COA94_04355 [Rickettsiales bacterium]|nr:MAG: hypothetical protein COA94_04355 [Rickettsiales bacterium]